MSENTTIKRKQRSNGLGLKLLNKAKTDQGVAVSLQREKLSKVQIQIQEVEEELNFVSQAGVNNTGDIIYPELLNSVNAKVANLAQCKQSLTLEVEAEEKQLNLLERQYSLLNGKVKALTESTEKLNQQAYRSSLVKQMNSLNELFLNKDKNSHD